MGGVRRGGMVGEEGGWGGQAGGGVALQGQGEGG